MKISFVTPFLTPDLAAVKERLQDGGVAVSEGVQGQFQLNDPEGNRVVVSQIGWTN